jgi:hypothetical protein
MRVIDIINKSKISHKKIGICLCIAIFTIVSTIGCTNGKTDNDNGGNSKGNDSDAVTVQEVKQYINNLDELYSEVQKGDKAIYIQSYANLLGQYDGRNFSDGVAWIYLDFGTFCIDKTGKILFILKDTSPVTDFNNGIAVLKNGDIINKTGKVILSKSSNMYDEVILKDKDRIDDQNKIYNGVVFVQKKTESYKGTMMSVGAIDNKGNWIIEPTTEFSKAEHIKDGIYNVGTKQIDDNRTEDIFFDVTTKKIITKDEVDKKNYSKLTFYNDGFYDFYKEAGMTSKMELGNKVIDLSKYKCDSNKGIETTASDFVDGYSLVDIHNKYEHTEWYTIIDKSGKEMFELRKLNDWETLGRISCGLLNIESSDKTDFIDVNGNTVIKGIPGHVGEFSEDLLFAEGSHCYINKKGKKVF